MAPNRHGRHSAVRPGRSGASWGAPLVAFLAVVMLAVGGWALLGRGTASHRPADVPRAANDTLSAPVPAAGSKDRGSQDSGSQDSGSRDSERVAAIPQLGGMAPARTTGAAGSKSPTTTSSAPAAGGSTRPGAPRPAPPASPGTSAPAAPMPTGIPAFEAEVTRLTNIERSKNGCAALRVDPRLQTAAELHSKDMVDRNYFDHTTPDGKGPGDRAAAQGYPNWSGENIAQGYPTSAAVVQGWMNSPGHRANILNCQSKATGVGFDARDNMWTQMFGFV
jgi:uncharacterized protein YkwD